MSVSKNLKPIIYFETIKEDTNIHNCVEQYVYKFEFHLKLIPSYSRKNIFLFAQEGQLPQK